MSFGFYKFLSKHPDEKDIAKKNNKPGNYYNQLKKNIRQGEQRRKHRAGKKKQRTEQFAYGTLDMQEPLRTTSSFAEPLQKNTKAD